MSSNPSSTLSGAVSLPRVFLIGDSISVHFGPYLEAALAGRVRYDRKRDSGSERAEDNLDIPRGANGGDSGMVLSYVRLRRATSPLLPGMLAIGAGLHDIKTDPATGAKQVPLERYRQNLEAIADEAKAMEQRLVWLLMPPVIDAVHNGRLGAFHRFSADVAAYNAAAAEILGARGADIVDFHAFCLPLVPAAFIDHVHYDEAARRKQGEFVAAELLARLGA